MAKQRTGVGAGVSRLMGDRSAKPRSVSTPGSPTSRKPASPVSRETGKPVVRKLTVDVPESVHNDYEDLYLELRRTHRKLKRVQYAPLVIRFGLDREKIEAGLKGTAHLA